MFKPITQAQLTSWAASHAKLATVEQVSPRRVKSLQQATVFDYCSNHPSHSYDASNIRPVQGGNHAYVIDPKTGNKRLAYVAMRSITPSDKRQGAFSWSIPVRKVTEHEALALAFIRDAKASGNVRRAFKVLPMPQRAAMTAQRAAQAGEDTAVQKAIGGWSVPGFNAGDLEDIERNSRIDNSDIDALERAALGATAAQLEQIG